MTDDVHHVVDYKTNAVDASEVESKADYYRTQMEAYAVALGQQAPDRAVTATLYVTTPAEPWTFEWSPAEVATLAERFEGRIEDELVPFQ